MSSITIITIGMLCLISSLIARYSEQTDLSIFVAWAGGWLGALLVIGGTGKLFFLDDSHE